MLKRILILATLVMIAGCSKGNQVAQKPATPAATTGWTYSQSKDPITDATLTTVSVTNPAGQHFKFVCSKGEGEPRRAIILTDDRIVSTGAMGHNVLVRVGTPKAQQLHMQAHKGTLSAVQVPWDKHEELSSRVEDDVSGLAVMVLSHALLGGAPDTLLARYIQGDDTIEFSFNVSGSEAAVRAVNAACYPGAGSRAGLQEAQ